MCVKKFVQTLLIFFILSQFEIVVAGGLSSIEKQIKDYLVEQQPAQLAFLEQLVNVNSGTTNLAGVRQVGEMLRPQFEQLGFKTRWIEQPAAMKRAGMFVAERRGSQGKRLLLIGHLDTVFSPDSSFQRFKRSGNIATGPGVIDIKGGDVVILYALKALAALHALDNTSITVVLTGDEEDSGKPTTISRRPLIQLARQSDIALDFECGASMHSASIARRGIMNWVIETHGKEGHSAGIFHKSTGYGAIFELTRILDAMRAKFSHEKYLSFNPGIILGGTSVEYDKNSAKGNAFGKQNVIASKALASGDLRFLTLEQKNNAKKHMRTIANQHLTGTNATVNFQDGIPSMPPTTESMALLQKYSLASIDLGYGKVVPLDPGARGAGDISFVANVVSAGLVGLGPIGQGAHTMHESLEIKSLLMQTQRAAVLIYRLTR